MKSIHQLRDQHRRWHFEHDFFEFSDIDPGIPKFYIDTLKNLVINEFEDSALFDKELSNSKTNLRRETSKIMEINIKTTSTKNCFFCLRFNILFKPMM